MIEIRKAKPEDAGELIKLIQLADDRTEEVASKKVNKFINSEKGFFLSAVDNKKIIGYALFVVGEPNTKVEGIKVGDYSYIDWIAVNPEFRNRKIGSKLLEEAMKYSKKYKRKGLSLTCRDSALEFYEKNGFKKIKTYQKENKKGRLSPCYMMMKERLEKTLK